MTDLHDIRASVIKSIKDEFDVNPLIADPGGQGQRELFIATQQAVQLRLLKQAEGHIRGVTVPSEQIKSADERLLTTLQNIGVDTDGHSISNIVDKALGQAQQAAIEPKPKQPGKDLLERGPQRVAPKGTDIVTR